MEEARKAAQVINLIPPQENNLCGNQNKSVNDTSEYSEKQSNPGKKQKNKLEHDRFNPKKFLPPDEHKQRYRQLSDLSKLAQDSYFNRKASSKIYFHLDAYFKPLRKMRSEFAELISQCSAMIFHYYHVATGKIGFYNARGKWVNVSCRTMSEKCGVSLARIKKFFKHLKELKYVTVRRQAHQDSKGRLRGKVAEKEIHASFIIETFGVKAWKKIKRLRDKIFKEKTHTNDKASKENLVILNEVISGAIKTKQNKGSDYTALVKTIPTGKVSGRDSHLSKEKKQSLMSKALEAFKRDGSKSVSQYYDLLIANVPI